MSAMSSTTLRVVFERPGWFTNDPRVTVMLDERALHEGSFLSGFDTTVEIACGAHVLSTAIHLGALRRTREYAFVLADESGYRDRPARHVARLAYSRFWGNFARKLDLTRE